MSSSQSVNLYNGPSRYRSIPAVYQVAGPERFCCAELGAGIWHCCGGCGGALCGVTNACGVRQRPSARHPHTGQPRGFLHFTAPLDVRNSHGATGQLMGGYVGVAIWQPPPLPLTAGTCVSLQGNVGIVQCCRSICSSLLSSSPLFFSPFTFLFGCKQPRPWGQPALMQE